MKQNMIDAQHVRFGYADEQGKVLPVLRDVSLAIETGTFVAVLGHNGSGKSTIAKHMNAVLLPTEGVIYVSGMDTKDETVLYEIRQNVGMVFQNPDNQIVATIVEEDVAFGPENMGVPPAEIRRRVDDALKDVGMEQYMRHAPHQLSGGQKQRIAIAGIIAMRPRCIVLDEPTAMLDPRGRQEVLKTIMRLNRENGITVVLITHYMEEAALADRVVVMNDGQILLDDTPRSVFSHVAQLKSVGLDVPGVTELCHLLREDGFDLPKDVIDPEECISLLRKLLDDVSQQKKAAVALANMPPEAPPNVTVRTDVPLAIETKEVSYVYSPDTPFQMTAVDKVSLQIQAGEFVGVIGHTGSGKSTLMQHLNGLLKPTSGRVLISGTDLWAKGTNLREYRFKVGLVFQYPEYQLFEETVYKDIAFGPGNMGLSKEDIDRRVRQAARFAGLRDELLDKSPFDLSGGQKRRVAIAGVLAMDPDILILDEPTAGLDPKGRDKILGEIKKYHKERGATVLLVSHSMEDIAKYAKKVLVLNKAGVMMYDNVANVFSRAEEITRIGLSAPQITTVFRALRQAGHSVNESVYTMDFAHREMLRLMAGKGAANA